MQRYDRIAQSRLLSRRRFVQASVAASGPLVLGVRAQEKSAKKAEVAWHDVQEWGVEGKGWQDCVKYFDRLPARAQKTVRPAVWNLSRHSAGMSVRFETDADRISVDYKVTSSRLAMPHMPATAVSGVDLYATDDQGEWRWLSVSKPAQQTTRTELISGLKPGTRSYTLYLPLYNGTEFLKVGVPSGASFHPIAPRAEKPIVFYGTSITHGACASRPGMPHPAILGRRLDMPVINLGFSGNGKMEAAVGALLGELDAAVYIIDCLPNMVAKEVAARTIPLVRQLRAVRPEAAILLVEDRTYPNSPFLPSRQARHASSRAALQAAFAELKQAGVERIDYLRGEQLLGEDREDTTDGSHPSDLGFYRQANAMEPKIKRLLSKA